MSRLWRAALLYLALTIIIAYPLSTHPGTHVLSDSSDTDLVVWILAWDIHAFVHQPWTIFDANIYYPLHHTLAFTENLIGSALFAAPIVWLTGNVVLAMNLIALSSCVGCGVGAYLLARRSGVAESGALVAGLVFAFAPPRFLRLDQLFLATIMWIPVSLAFLQTYLDDGRPRDLRLAVGFFALQALASGHGAVFLVLAASLLVVHRLARGGRVELVRRLPRDLGVPGVLLLAAVLLMVLPYRSVQTELGLRRSLDDWRVPRASSFLAAPTYVQGFLTSRILPNAHINDSADAYLFPGWTVLLLAGWAIAARAIPRARAWASAAWPVAALATDTGALAALATGTIVAAHGAFRLKVGGTVLFSAREGWRVWLVAVTCVALRIAMIRRVPFATWPISRVMARGGGRARTRRSGPMTVYAALVVLSVWLAIGPPLSLWPFVYWLPGFNFVRVSSRFTLLGVLGLAMLAGAGLEAASERLSRRAAIVAALVVGALICVECLVPLGVAKYQINIPEADAWLATQPKPFAVAEVPLPDIRRVGLFNKFQSIYMLHSTVHWQKTVHGWSGLMPVSHLDLFDALVGFPDEQSLRALNDFKVDYIVVHGDLYPRQEWPDVERRLQALPPRVRLVHVDGAERVYALH
jgi:hypothetical protein